jgi:hypothetical protein
VEGFLMFVVLATLAEAAWETSKMFWQEGKFSWDRVGALLIAELIAIGTGADVFGALGYPLNIPWLGVILTGLLMSRGANFIHELLTGVQGLTTKTALANKDVQRYLDNTKNWGNPVMKEVSVDIVKTEPKKTILDDGKTDTN